MAKPFVKWAGGKRQLLPEILSRLPEDIEEIETFVEPFVGGGALLFQMIESYNFKEIHIFDINLELINCYRQIQESVERVIHYHELLISKFPENGDERDDFYYDVRNKWNSNLDIQSMSSDEKSERVAEMIFLNKTCFNGLFRLNREGKFNVPTGRYKKPSFTNSEDLIKASEALKGVHIHHASFENCLNVINDSSFVYFDPPYRPLSKTSAFVSYSKSDFNDSNQRELATLANDLDVRKVKFLLSNSDPKNTDVNDNFFDEMYSDFKIDRVFASRAINSNPNKRGKISELLIKNY